MPGEGFLILLGKLRAEVIKKRRESRRADDELSEAEHKLQEAIIRYNDSIPREALTVPPDSMPDSNPAANPGPRSGK